MATTPANGALQVQNVFICSRMAKGKAFIREHASINKLITTIGSIAAAAIAYTTHHSKPMPINFKKMMAVATLFMVQKQFADLCNGVSRRGNPIPLYNKRVVRYLPNNPIRRQNLLLFSFFAKLNLSLYAFKTLQKRVLPQLPAFLRMPLRIAAVAGLTALAKRDYQAERGMITRTLTEQDREAKQQLQGLELRVGHVLRTLCSNEEQVVGLQQYFTTSHLQGPHVVVSGFGQSWSLRPHDDLTTFNTTIQTATEQARTNPLIGLDAAWLRTDDSELYQTRQQHFRTFESQYYRSNAQDRTVIATFAKIYPFDEAAGDIASMKAFIRHHKERTLIAAQPKLADTIRTLYATSHEEQTHSITTTAYMMRHLCLDLTDSLELSKQRGRLTPECEHQLTQLRELIDPEAEANQVLLRELDKVRQDTITHLDIRVLKEQIAHLRGVYEGDRTEDFLTWLHSDALFIGNLKDANTSNTIKHVVGHLATATQMQHLTADSEYLEGLRAQAEEAQENCGKCNRLTKKTARYTAITSGAAGALYLGFAPWMVIPAALYAVPAVKRRIDRAINTQVRSLTDTGQTSVERAIGNASAQLSRVMNTFSLKTQLHRIKRSVEQNAADIYENVMNHFSPEAQIH